MFKKLCLCLTLLWFCVGTAQAQIITSEDLNLATARSRALVYEGPSETYVQNGVLSTGIVVTITERNTIGNWLHITRRGRDGTLVLDGWVLTGYLDLNPALRFSEVPINTILDDADTSTLDSHSMRRLYSVPVISEVSDAMREVYQYGLELGNQPNVITKVGDSLTADPIYLAPMAQARVELGPYDYLSDTVDFFGASTADVSVAARIGMTSLVIFDPFWSDRTLCEANEAPLDCEYRLKRPSIALIMFGPNDVLHMTDDEFAEQMELIVQESLAQGIIPVLSTFSYHPDSNLWWQSVNFNLVLVDLAAEYEVPLVNLWVAARPLPEYGLDIDGIHMLHSGFTYLKYDTGHEAFYGVSLRNLLSICMLDEIRRTLEMESNA